MYAIGAGIGTILKPFRVNERFPTWQRLIKRFKLAAVYYRNLQSDPS